MNLNKNPRPRTLGISVYNELKQNIKENTFWEYMDHFTMIALRLFEYDNLPEGIFSKTIEENLFYTGQCVLTKHPTSKKLIVLPCSTYSQNAMGQPLKFKAYSYSGDNKPRKIVEGDISYDGKSGDGVVFNNNYLRRPTQDMLSLWCLRLADIDLTKDQNIFAMRKPFILLANDDTENSARALYEKYETFEPLIIVEDKKKSKKKKNMLESDHETLADKLMLFQTGVQDHTTSLQDSKQDVINWIYTMFNINNGESRKRERMLVDEVNINNEQIDVSENISLKERQEAVEIANKLFNLNMKVERSVEYGSTNDGGEVYDNDKGSSGSLSHESNAKKL